MRPESLIVIGDKVTVVQGFVNDASCVERMESLANVLQDQDVRAIFNPRNLIAETKRLRAETLITAFSYFLF